MVRHPVVGRGRSGSLFQAFHGAGLRAHLSEQPGCFGITPLAGVFSVLGGVLVFPGPPAHASAASRPTILRAEPPAPAPRSLTLSPKGHTLVKCMSGMLLEPACVQSWWLRPKGDDACRSLRQVVESVCSLRI